MQHLEEFFRKSSFQDRNFPIDEGRWQKLETALDQGKRRKGLAWWFGAGTLLIVASATIYQLSTAKVPEIEALAIPMPDQKKIESSESELPIAPVVKVKTPATFSESKATQSAKHAFRYTIIDKNDSERPKINVVSTEQEGASLEVAETPNQVIALNSIAEDVAIVQASENQSEELTQQPITRKVPKSQKNYAYSSTNYGQEIEQKTPVGGTSIAKIAPKPLGPEDWRSERTGSWIIKASAGLIISNFESSLAQYSTTPNATVATTLEYAKENGERIELYFNDNVNGRSKGSGNFYLYRLNLMRQFDNGFGVKGGLIYGRIAYDNSDLVDQINNPDLFYFTNSSLDQFWTAEVGVQYLIATRGRWSGTLGLSFFKTIYGQYSTERKAFHPAENFEELDFRTSRNYGWEQGWYGYLFEGAAFYRLSDRFSIGLVSFLTGAPQGPVRLGFGIETAARF
jgi:hypothetical protein